MRINLKRTMCLFLTLVMLLSLFPTPAFAANFMGPGIGTAPPGGGPVGNNDTEWTYAQTVGAGILLDVAQSAKNTSSDENWAENVRYWTENFPSTSAEGSTPDGYYVLPNEHSRYTQYAIQMKENGRIDWSCNPIYGVYMFDSNTVKNNIGLGAYNKATGNISDSNPGPNLPADYWRKEIPLIANDGAGNIISNLFSAIDPSFGYRTAADTEAVNQRILDYLGRVDGSQNSADTNGIEDKSATDLWNFFMYCGFIANVIACLPAHEQAQKAAQLDSMCQNYLKGEPYQPMVVTGELVVASEYNNNNTEVYWWTAKQCIRAVTGSFPSSLSSMGGSDFLTRIAEACHKAQKNYGGRNMYGHPENGNWVKSGYNPQYGWLLQSLSQSTLDANQVGNKPIPGFGVWGLGDKAPERQDPIPPTSAEKGKMTPMGDCSIEVMEPTYIEESLSYSEELDVTVKVNLNGRTNSTTTTTTEEGMMSSTVDGVGIANSLRWLKKYDTSGANKPEIWIYVKYTDPSIKSTTAEAAERLKQNTYGYFGSGVVPNPNDEGVIVTPEPNEENAAGISVEWQQPNLSQLVWQDPGAQGFTCVVDSDRIRINITDYDAAIAYFDTHESSVTFKGKIPIKGNLESEDDVKQVWFKVGSNVHMGGPSSLDDMHTITSNTVSLRCRPKYAWTTIRGKPEEKPFYYSQYKDPYSEVKQGTVPSSGGGSSEKFNSMTGTPTFTETHNKDCTSNGANTVEQASGMNPTGVRSDLMGTPYESNGHYYQYFASGGSEFVVQFDGEYVETADATRTYTATFSNVLCDNDKGPCQAPHTHGSDPPSPCSTCHQTHGCVHNTHQVGDTYTWTQNVKGFSYVKIKNLKVWKLARAEFEGNETYTLLDTNEVYATVQANAPALNYNIAGADTSAEGRLVYSWEPAQNDTVTIPGYPKNSDRSCTGHTDINQATLDGDTAGITCEATCVSDFIVLNTSNGDQSILYYEYKSKNKAAINTGGCVAEDIEFEKVPYETIWTNNSQTSEGCKLPEDGITYGGYNGDYMSTGTKYKSQGHPKNITWSSTTAYKNESKVYGAKANSALNKKNVTQKFRLMNDKIVIPDCKQNGEYILGRSYVFYENIVNFGPDQPLYPISQVARFDNQKGFELETTYSPNHSKLNDIVVFDPVSNQYAMIISLPDERDQRSTEHEVYHVQEDNTCPGNATCPYLKQDCEITTHYHTESCFVQQNYEVHTGFNVHEHTDKCKGSAIQCGPNSPCMSSGTHNSSACPFGHGCNGCTTCHVCKDGSGSAGGGQWYWTHESGCTYAGETHITTSTSQCTQCGHSCGALGTAVSQYICDNKPLNKHVCGADAGGGLTAGASKSFGYSGIIESISLAPGTYTLEAYGAQGNGAAGGLGGYSKGTFTISQPTTLYVGVGAQNGYNGGGAGTTPGGGATHFATSTGTLASLEGNKGSILLVAGGGGGSGPAAGGAGGGANQNGTDGTKQCGTPGIGATPTDGGEGGQQCGTKGSFGQGGNGTCLSGHTGNGQAGGGGGYYGGGGGGHDCPRYNDSDDSGGGGGSGYAATSIKNPSGTPGTRSGDGFAKITAVSVNPVKSCYTVQKSVMSCADPHHAYSYFWKIYTYQLYHTSGRKCTGQGCTDTTSLLFPTQKEYSITQCANGGLVRHSSGEVHLTTSNMKNGVCAFCGKSYQTYIANAQSSNRAIGADEWSHYDYGDARCWSPCGNPNNHTTYVDKTTDENGVVIEMGDFINLDWPFTLYFPNTGNFYGTGRKASSNTTAERGHGYTNNMDTTEWVLHKWVEFPFAVLHKGVTYVPYERIYLAVPETKFEFYVPLQDHEYSNAEIIYGTVAINTQNGDQIECGKNENHNIKEISYMGRPMAHQHNADKRQYIDVVGRIGSLAIEDTGDWRWANFFKQPITTGWIVTNLVRNVNLAVQNNLVIDQVDVRGVPKDDPKDSTGHKVYLDTYGTKAERDKLGNEGKLHPFPLTPSINNITALRRQPTRLGYDTLLDFETLGDYTGDTWGDTTSFCLIKPHFFRMDINTGELKPVDVYMDTTNGKKVLINDHDSRTVSYGGKDSSVYLNWQDTAERRNYAGNEVTFTNEVAEFYEWVKLPSGTSWFYGNFNLLNLTQRNRTFIGSQDTYGWTKDPSEKLPDVQYSLQGQRWHFGINLPSSSSFVFSGDKPTTENVNKCIPDTSKYVIVGALEIYAQGETWTLVYDGKTTNQPFQVTPTSPVIDPAPKNPKDPDKEMPIVVIYSPNHSSKEDLNVSGTH